jgi:hypothetical protein
MDRQKTPFTLQAGPQILADGSLLRSSQTQVGEPKIGRACAVTLFRLSNPDVEVIGSLLLVYCVLLSRADFLFLSADEISSQHRLTLMRRQ